MSDIHKRPKEKTAILGQLHQKFGINITAAAGVPATETEKVEARARAFAVVGMILSETSDLTATQREILTIYDELFADTVCSLYFAACALDKPAQMLLRRVLELGVGIVYLWDLPHLYWGWKTCDLDLSFKEMTDHLSSPQYRAYLTATLGPIPKSGICDFVAARAVYRDLSNIVHGKPSTFESVLPDRFNFTHRDWDAYLALAKKVEDLLLDLWQNRFPLITKELPKRTSLVTLE
jgi:hypothetical protein